MGNIFQLNEALIINRVYGYRRTSKLMM